MKPAMKSRAFIISLSFLFVSSFAFGQYTNGQARMGSWLTGTTPNHNYAAFGAKGVWGQTGYALLQYKTGATFVNAAGGKNIYFRDGNSGAVNSLNMMIRGSDGFVGIATNAPTQRLHVNGRSYLSSNVGIGIQPMTNTYKLAMGGHIHMGNKAINFASQYHFNNGLYLTAASNKYLNVRGVNTTQTGVRLQTKDQVTRAYFYASGTHFGVLNGSGKWLLHGWNDGTEVRAPAGKPGMKMLHHSTNRLTAKWGGTYDQYGNVLKPVLEVKEATYGTTMNFKLNNQDQGAQILTYANQMFVQNQKANTPMNLMVMGNLQVTSLSGNPNGTGQLRADRFYADSIYTHKLCVAQNFGDCKDIVFEPDYPLMELSDVETFVKEEKHLPGIPSAREFVENGNNLAVFTQQLLGKIEELTLYTIEQQKRIAALEAKFVNQEKGE